jgi:hypothetical protein
MADAEHHVRRSYSERTQRLLAAAVGAPVLALLVFLTVYSIRDAYESEDPLIVAGWVYAFVFVVIPLGIGPVLYLAMAALPNGSVRRSVTEYGFWLPVSIGIPFTLLALLVLTEPHGGRAALAILVPGIFSLAMGGGLWLLGRMTPRESSAIATR